MPRYDYKCSACGAQYEKREGFDAPAVQVCPTCQGEARRVLTPPAIVFKGSGWYVNDSRKGSPSSDGAASPPASDSTSSSSDAKESTAAKPESNPSSAPATPAAPAATSSSSGSGGSNSSGS